MYSRILVDLPLNSDWLWDEMKTVGAAQCGKCGSILVDTKYAVDILKKKREKLVEEDEDLEDFASDLMVRLLEIGVPEELWRNQTDLNKYIENNEYRLMESLMEDYGDFVFLRGQEVVFKTKANCPCFPIGNI